MRYKWSVQYCISEGMDTPFTIQNFAGEGTEDEEAESPVLPDTQSLKKQVPRGTSDATSLSSLIIVILIIVVAVGHLKAL